MYLNGVQRRAYHEAALSTVYVAGAPIPRGTTAAHALQAGLIHQESIPTKFRPATAVSGLADLRDEVAGSDIAPQQMIVAGLFVAVATTGGAAAQQIPPGDVAISISVDAVHGVAGLVQPGDKVDLLVQLSNGGKEATLYQNVPVLATGSNVAETQTAAATSSAASGQAPASGLVTFAVPLDAAERIAMAQGGAGGTAGSIYLALVPPGNIASPVPTVGSQNLIPLGPTPS
jgi:pilus assembly protein CpaB